MVYRNAIDFDRPKENLYTNRDDVRKTVRNPSWDVKNEGRFLSDFVALIQSAVLPQMRQLPWEGWR